MSEPTRKPFNIAETFGFQTADPDACIEGRAERTPFVPAIDPSYVFRKTMFRVLMGCLYSETRDGLYFYGPPGSGKTSFVRQVAARLNIPVREQTVSGSTDAVDIWGTYMPQHDGTMRFELSPITEAAQNGEWCIVNEVDAINPAVALAFNGLLDGTPFEVNDPEHPGQKLLVQVHPDFKLFVTGNTAGTGDASGFFQGTKIQNSAFLDRFWYDRVDYPTEEEEIPLVEKWLSDMPDGVRGEYAKRFVAVANDIRKLYLGTSDRRAEPFDYTMTLRTLRRWVTGFVLFRNSTRDRSNPIDFALEHAFTARMSAADAEAVHEIAHLHFADLPNAAPQAAPQGA